MNENNTNEIVTEVIENGVNTKVMKICGVAGLTLLVSGLAYKFVVKPIVKKHNEKKASVEVVEETDFREVDSDEE